MNNCIVKRRTIDVIINNKLHERMECKYNGQGEITDGDDTILLSSQGKHIFDKYGNCIFLKVNVDNREVIITCDIEYYN